MDWVRRMIAAFREWRRPPLRNGTLRDRQQAEARLERQVDRLLELGVPESALRQDARRADDRMRGRS